MIVLCIFARSYDTAVNGIGDKIAGSDGVLMIEGESDFVGEEDMMRAIEVGHAAVRDLCLGECNKC